MMMTTTKMMLMIIIIIVIIIIIILIITALSKRLCNEQHQQFTVNTGTDKKAKLNIKYWYKANKFASTIFFLIYCI
jgi:uncharacterized membrane protein YqiK